MPVISVEVPEFIAKKFVSYKIVSSKNLYEELENSNIFVDFWETWISKKDFDTYNDFKKLKKMFS